MFFKFPPCFRSVYVFWLNYWRFLLSPYLHHDAFMHHALRVLDAPGYPNCCTIGHCPCINVRTTFMSAVARDLFYECAYSQSEVHWFLSFAAATYQRRSSCPVIAFSYCGPSCVVHVKIRRPLISILFRFLSQIASGLHDAIWRWRSSLTSECFSSIVSLNKKRRWMCGSGGSGGLQLH